MATQTKYASSVITATNYADGSNAYASDNAYSTFTNAARRTVGELVLGVAAFTIPSGATINTVTAYIERSWSSGASSRITSAYFQISLGGTLRGTRFSESAYPTTDTEASTDGGTWTISELNGGTMRGHIDTTRDNNTVSTTHSVDTVYVVVDYTEAALDIAPSGIATEEAFGSATITTGAVSVAPTGIVSEEAFGSHTISGVIPPQTLEPTGIASEETFGSHTVAVGALTIAPDGITSEESFGSHTLLVGAVFITPTGITSEETFGSHTLTLGALNILPTGIVSEETFGTARVSSGASLIETVSITSEEAFGTVTVILEAYLIQPTGIASAEAFGNHALTTGEVFIVPNGISSAEAFGLHLMQIVLTGVLRRQVIPIQLSDRVLIRSRKDNEQTTTQITVRPQVFRAVYGR